MLVRVSDSFVILFFELVLVSIGIRISAAPELLDEPPRSSSVASF
jgi:hypothetical protein